MGTKFSEGARLLWGKIEGRKLLLAEAARKLKWPRSTLARVLYGERLPGVALLADVARVFRVPMGRWAEPPTVAFVPPGARGLKQRGRAA